MFRLFAKKYGWTADQVARLTPIQAMMYLEGDESEQGEVRFDSLSDAFAYQERRRQGV